MNRLYLIIVCILIFLVVAFNLTSLVLANRETVLKSNDGYSVQPHSKSEMHITKAGHYETSQVTSDSMESIGMNTSVMDEEQSTNSKEILASPLFYHIDTSEYSHLSESQQNSLNIIMQKYITYHNNYNFSVADIDEWERQVQQINMELVNSLGSDITGNLFRGGGSD